MAKQSGLGATVTIDDSGGTPRAITNDVNSFEVATPLGTQDITGVDKSAMERLLLLVDASVTLDGTCNFAATTSSHAVFSTVTSTRVNRTTAILVGSGGGTLTFEAIYSGYTIKRSEAAELTWNAAGALADGTAPAWS